MARTDRKNIRAERREGRQERKDVRKNVKSERKGPREVGAPPGAGTGRAPQRRTADMAADTANQRDTRTSLAALRDRAASKAFARDPAQGEQVVKGAGGYTYYFNPETQSVYIAEAPGGRGVGTTLTGESSNQTAYKAILSEIGPEVGAPAERIDLGETEIVGRRPTDERLYMEPMEIVGRRPPAERIDLGETEIVGTKPTDAMARVIARYREMDQKK